MKKKLLDSFCSYMEIPLPQSSTGHKYRWDNSIPFFSELEIVFNPQGFVEALGVPMDDLYYTPLFRYAQEVFTNKAGDWREDIRVRHWEKVNEGVSSIPAGVQ